MRGLLALGLAIVLHAGPVIAGPIAANPQLHLAATMLSIFRPAADPRVEPIANAGAVVFTLPVDYLYTGTLLNPDREGLLLPIVKAIPPGTHMFGLPMSKPTGIGLHPDLMWCAVSGGPETTRDPARRTIICFPKLFNAVHWVDAGGDMAPTALAIQITGPEATTPQIDERPVGSTLPLEIALQFVRWTDDGADVILLVRQPDRRTLINIRIGGEHLQARLHLARAPDGACHISFYGGEVQLRPGSDPNAVMTTVAKPFQRPAFAAP